MFDVVHAHRRYIFANGLGTRLRLLVNGLHEAGRDSNHDHQEGCGRPALTAPGGYSVQGEPAMRLLRTLRGLVAAIAITGASAAATATPTLMNMWCLNSVDPATGVETMSQTKVYDATKQYRIVVRWDDQTMVLATDGLHPYDIASIQMQPWPGGLPTRFMSGRIVAAGHVTDRGRPVLRSRDEEAGLWIELDLATVAWANALIEFITIDWRLSNSFRVESFASCRVGRWVTGEVLALSQAPGASTPRAASQTSQAASTASSAPTISSAPTLVSVSASAPSADAELSYRGSIVAALIGAAIAAAVGVPAVWFARHQAKVGERALAHSIEQEATKRSREKLLQIGPDAVVARLQRLADEALRAAERGDMAVFEAQARALSGLRDSLHRNLVAAVAPLNSNMDKLSRLLDQANPNLDEAAQLIKLTSATFPDKALELRNHLRQLLAAIDAVLETGAEVQAGS